MPTLSDITGDRSAREVRVPSMAGTSLGRLTQTAVVILLMLFLPTGCQVTPKSTFSADRPSRHTITSRYFVVHSDIPIADQDPMIRELEGLQQQITSTLQLPEQRDPVTVYLFTDEVTYRYYMQTTWGDLPPRRAYFVGTSRELAVYSFRSPQLQEDLRHEFTHGVLHACLETVPLWLDEGLAEYFEVRGTSPGMPHREHLAELQIAKDEGWGPNLFQLETIRDFRHLTQRDYAESWAWVHFLLNSQPEGKNVLLSYLAELRSSDMPSRLLPSMEKVLPNYYAGLQSHVSELHRATLMTAGR